MKETAVKKLGKPNVRKVRRLSLVWVVPVLALALASYLVYQQFLERGLALTLVFPEAKGLVPGKTELRYQGFKVGVVSHLSFNAKTGQFTAHINAMRDLEPLLKTKTQFWLVKPKASLLGVSGLDTLISGNYIAMLPGKGDPSRHFVARRTPPPEPVPDGVFMVELALHDLGSLSEGSPVYYRHVPVGEVHSYRLDKAAGAVILQLTFHENYADLVKRDSRFQDVSGLKVKASLSGIKVESQGLVPMLTGGLVMDSPNDSPKARYGQRFVLDKAHRFSYQVHLNVPGGGHYLPQGTPVIARQHVIGEVINSNDSGVLVGFTEKPIDPFYAWIAERSLKNFQVQTLLHPHYIRLLSGVDGRHVLHDNPPIPSANDSELYVQIASDQKLADGTPVQYKGFTVGEVIYSELEDHQAIANVSINSKYRTLVTQQTHFYSSHPVAVDASLDGIKVNTSSVKDWWQGAVRMVPGKGPAASYGARFTLDPKPASEHHLLTLTASPPRALPKGAPVRWHGFQVGEVISSTLTGKGQQADIAINLNNSFQLRRGMRFYFQPAMAVDASLQGVKVTVPDLKTLAGGAIMIVDTHTSSRPQLAKQLPLYASQQAALNTEPPVQLSVPAGTEAQIGMAVKFLGAQVGHVSHISDQAKQRILSLQFKPGMTSRFARKGSRFRLITPNISLSGVSHLDALLGSYIAVQPVIGKKVPKQQRFVLAKTPYPHHQFTLTAAVAGDLSVGSPVWYRDLPVGEIQAIKITPDGGGVSLTLAINEQAARWVTSNSTFWIKSGFQANFGLFSGLTVKSGSLSSMAQGGIQFATRPGGHTLDGPLPLQASAPDGWQQWQPQAPSPQ